MDFKGQNIEEWFCDQYNDSKCRIYITKYNNIKNILGPIHEEVKAVVARIDSNIFLNSHGNSHIKMVLDKVSMLLMHRSMELKSVEVYFLLLAIQFHDIGHIYNGRSEHAKAAGKIITKIDNNLLSQIEKQAIFKIAAAHSGKEDDPISQLLAEDSISNEIVRYRLLASLVRLADELADGTDRASNYMLSEDLIPAESKIYHIFSSCLDTFIPELETHSIRMKFYLNRNQISCKYKKGELEKFLIDEIYERTLTTFTECLYYNRFVPEYIRINEVNVEIKFPNEIIFEPDIHEPIKYVLKENGYPNLSVYGGIFGICKTDLVKDNIKIDGEYIYQQIKQILDNETAKSI